MLKLSMLCENYTSQKHIFAELGLSLFVEHGAYPFLLDTGLTGLLAANAKAMEIDLSSAELLVISHGHIDHAGGLLRFFELNASAPVYADANAISYIFSTQPDVAEKYENRFTAIDKPTELRPNIFMSGPVEMLEPMNEASRISYEGREMDEQFLIVREADGIYVLLGCSHPGAVNCITHAKKMFPNENIRAVVGGMHLSKEPAESVASTASALRGLGVAQALVTHCTGLDAYCVFKQVFGSEACRYFQAGTVNGFNMPL